MLAQWVALAYREAFQAARREPLITLGLAPLEAPEFEAVVLGQLGEPRLATAIAADIAGPLSRARALDTDTKGALCDVHRRVGAAILFESSGDRCSKVATLSELRFALGEPEVDHLHRHRRCGAGGARLLHPPGGGGWVSAQPPGHAAQGGER